MKTVNLVVFTGYPHSGKTTIANFLVKHGFLRLEIDQIRKELFGRGFPNVNDEEERLARLTFQYRKADILASGKSVMLDSCSISKVDRQENFLIPDFVENSLRKQKMKLRKYLIFLDVKRKIIIKRNISDNREKKALLDILGKIDKSWQDPKSYNSKDVKLLVYKNNTKQDLENIKVSLRKLLK